MSRASPESRISPLTASAVTRATTSLHKGPPFIVVRLVRELMSVRVHAARFLPLARPRSCSSRGRLTPFVRAPTQFTLTSFWINCELNLWMWLCVSFHDKVFVNKIGSIVNTSHFLEVQVALCCFLLDPQVIGVQMPLFAQSSSGHNCESCARISQYHSIHVCAEVCVHRDESHCFGRRSH